MMIKEIYRKIKYWKNADRIGPDIPLTHWRLHFKTKMFSLCKAKFGAFGEGAEFRPGAYAITCSKIHIGKNVIIRPSCMLFADSREGDEGTITIEENAMLGSGVHIYVANHRFDNPEIPIIDQGHYPPKSVILKKGCWVGANSIILPGVIIGENAVVGAGSVVTKNVVAKTIVAGCPAKIINIR